MVTEGATMTFTISAFWAQIMASLVIAGVVGLFTLMLNMLWKLSSIEVSIAKVDGRLNQSEQWQQMHEKQDQDRHDETHEDSANLWRAIEKVRG